MEKRQILCYGDSNTWGFMPGSGQRYPAGQRWPGVMAHRLGEPYHVVEAGLNGRTTVFDDPVDHYRNGLKSLGATLLQACPLDLVILALGTNDLKFTDARESARGISALISETRKVLTETAHIYEAEPWVTPVRILVIAPILVHPDLEKISPDTTIRGGYVKSLGFAASYQAAADKAGAWFLDGSRWASPSDVDGVHMMPAAHRSLGLAAADKVREIFREEV